jgi:hypothetical protein
MNKDLHDIDDLFKNSIEGHTENVPPDVWENIDHQLDKKQAAFYKQKYFKTRAAAIILLLVGCATIAAILHYNAAQNRPLTKPVTQYETNNLNGETADHPVKANTTKTIKQNSNTRNNTVNQSSENLQSETSGEENSAEKNSTIKNVIDVNKTVRNENIKIKNKSLNLLPENKNNTVEIIQQEHFNNTTKKATIIAKENKVTESNNELTTDLLSQTVHRTGLLNQDLLVTPKNINAADLFSNFSSKNNIAPEYAVISKKARAPGETTGFSITPSYQQLFSLNKLEDDDHFRDPRNNSREVKHSEQNTISFSAGATIQKQITNHLSVETGVLYYSSQTNIQPKMVFANKDNNGDVRYQFHCSSGYSYFNPNSGASIAVGDSVRTNGSKSSRSYLSVPVLISYAIPVGRFSIIPSTGIVSNFLLKGNLQASIASTAGNEKLSSAIDGLKKNYFSWIVQPSIAYQLNDRLSVVVDPNVKLSLTPINKGTVVRTFENNIGIGAGVRVKL